jgi:DNA-binding response OmpR family regulator/DNA-binding CsgD family transcriptional regulator
MSAPTSSTVLVVDDVPANLGLLLDALTQAGLRVLVAESGEGALAQLDHEIPDLILLDFMLPGLDGIEVCRRIRQRSDCTDVPVIFLTAIQETSEKVRALEAGAVDYVTKPIQTAEVIARVRTHLRLAQLQRELAEELAMRREAEEQLRDSLDRALILAAAGGRIRFATRLASALLARHFPETPQHQLPPLLLHAMSQATSTPPEARPPTRLPDALEIRVLRAATLSEPGVLELASHETAGPSALLALHLTPREAEVLYWLSEGKTNPEIALILSSARRTVEKHVEHILQKLGVENRAAATRMAVEHLRQGTPAR